MKAWILLLLTACPLRAQPDAVPVSTGTALPSLPTPPILKPIVHKASGGMLLLIPIVDTDPNRGTAWGILPTWVLHDPSDPTNIRQIHAPSLDYNPTFGVTGTYRYFLYPKPDAQLKLRAALSEIIMHELLFDYRNMTMLGSRIAAGGRAQWNIDGSMRFYGVGPATPSSQQTNYTQDFLGYKVFVGYPLYDGLYLYAKQHLNGVRVTNGPIRSLPPTGRFFPDAVTGHRHEDGAEGLSLTYDTRDNPDTTTEGFYADFSAETGQRGAASEFTYQRYGSDVRGFFKRDGAHRLVTAARLRFDQLKGPPVPFWIQPQLGGKYSLRAYGDGRFTDRGLLSTSLEERFLVYQRNVADTAAELEIGPFLEAGAVFQEPATMKARTIRPVYGFALRAVARPQVVASIDIGLGQEGAATFMDINYSF